MTSSSHAGSGDIFIQLWPRVWLHKWAWFFLAVLLLAACSSPPAPSAAPTTFFTPSPTHSPSQAGKPSLGISRLNHGSPHVWDNNLRFERLNSGQGLSQNTIFSIVQDPQGFMWFATSDGLNRFDGYRFTQFQYDPDDPASLSDNTVSTLYVDRQGVLWAGTPRSGVNRFDRHTGSFLHIRHDPAEPSSLSSDCIRVIYEDSYGDFWVGTCDAGLNRLNRETGRAERFTYSPAEEEAERLSHNEVTAIYEDHQRVLWIGTGVGLDMFDRYKTEFFHFSNDPANPSSFNGSPPASLLEDESGFLWVATENNGLDRLDRQSGAFTHYRNDPYNPDSLVHNSLRAILEDDSGNLWIATYGGGLDRLERQSGHFIHYQRQATDPHSLSSDLVTALYQDRSGVIWIGTNGQGLNRYNPNTSVFATYRHLPGTPYSLINPEVYAILEDGFDTLWIGTSKGLDRFQRSNGLFSRYQKNSQNPYGLSDDFITALARDKEDVIWVGTNSGGLNSYDRRVRKFIHYRSDPTLPYSLSSDHITSLFLDSQDHLWVGTANRGLNRLVRQAVPDNANTNLPNVPLSPQGNPFTVEGRNAPEGSNPGAINPSEAFIGSFKRYVQDPARPDTLSSNEIRAMAEDESGLLWIGTRDGLNLLNPQTGSVMRYLHHPQNPHSLGDNSILSLLAGRDHQLWVGTDGGGLDRLDRPSGRFTHYRQEQGLPNNVVFGLLQDQQGYLWLSTNKGLSRFDPQTETFFNLDVQDGLQGDEFNPGAYFQARSGELFFGGFNGVTAFFPEQIHAIPYAPPVVLTSLTQNGQPLELDTPLDEARQITLSWPDNFFEFEFAALDFTQPDHNQYAYMLEGFDREWIYTGSQRSGRYTNLPGRQFTLRLKASNSDSFWNEAGESITIRVVPPFWQTLWFRGLAALLLVAVIAGGYSYRLKSVQARNRALQSLVQQRTADLESTTRNLEERNREIEQRQQELEVLYEQARELAALEERNRLARDLHDSAKQKAFAALAQLGAAGALLERAGQSARPHLDEAEELVHEVLQEIDAIVQELHPAALRQLGLSEAVREYAYDWSARNEIEIQLQIEGQADLPLNVEQALFRIVQEALANVARHSGAQHVILTLRCDPDMLLVSVQDNGRGFDLQQQHTGLGLCSMRERADQIKAHLSIESQPQQGARVTLRLPLDGVQPAEQSAPEKASRGAPVAER